jgi:lipopolysaccharide export system protein LptA
MKNLLLLCSLSLGLFPFLISAQEIGVPEDVEKITEITSDKLLFDYGEKLAIFTGNVVVTDPDMQMTSDKLVVHLTDADEIKLIEGEGNVVIKMEGMHSQSGKAVYEPATGKLVLTDQPQVSRKGSILQGLVITYFQLEDRLEAEKPRLLNFQGTPE